MLARLAGALGARVFGGLPLFLLIAVAGLAMQSNSRLHRAERAEMLAAKEKAAHRETKAAYRTAAAQAEARAISEKLAADAANADRERTSNAALDAALDRNRALADAYRLRNRATPGTAADSAPGGANLSGPADAAPGDNGPRDHADLVTITPRDFEACTVNTTRLVEARAWALTPGTDRTNTAPPPEPQP